MVKFPTHKQLLVLMLRTTVFLAIQLLETVFACAKLMVLGLKMNQFVRVSWHRYE